MRPAAQRFQALLRRQREIRRLGLWDDLSDEIDEIYDEGDYLWYKCLTLHERRHFDGRRNPMQAYERRRRRHKKAEQCR